MTLNDLECPIHLKMRVPDDTPDLRTLYVLAFRADRALLNEHGP